MITTAILVNIYIMCSYHIDPRFDFETCERHMKTCMEDKGNFEVCSEYWEPHYGEDEDLYVDDVGIEEADWSY